MNISCAELVRGQANLDKMKQEINLIINMCLNHIKPFEFKARCNKSDYLPIEEGGIYWRIEALGDRDFEIFFSRVSLHNSITESIVSSERISPRVANVQAMYEALPIFLNGMLTHFPQLEERLSTYINASKACI